MTGLGRRLMQYFEHVALKMMDAGGASVCEQKRRAEPVRPSLPWAT